MDTLTLGLSFRTRTLSWSVFKSNHLVTYSIKLYKEMWSPQKRDLILTSLASCIENYTISAIALSMPHPSHQTEEFREMLAAIEIFAHVHGIPIVSYSVSDIYRYFGSPSKRTRNSLMKRVALFYPELHPYYDKELRNRNKFYIKLFEAVAVGAYHWLESNRK